MPTATQPKAARAANELIDLIGSRRGELLSAAEEILRASLPKYDKIAGMNMYDRTRRVRGQFDPQELGLFDALAWSNERLSKEWSRLHVVVSSQERAGTTAERAAAAERLAKATVEWQDEKGRAAELKRQLAAAERELKQIETEFQQADNQVNLHKSGLAALRKAVPRHVEEQFNPRQLRIKAAYNAEIQTLEQQVRQLSNRPQPPEPQDYREGVQAKAADNINAAEFTKQQAAFAEATAGLRPLAELQAELAELRAARDKQLRELEAELLDMYAR